MRVQHNTLPQGTAQATPDDARESPSANAPREYADEHAAPATDSPHAPMAASPLVLAERFVQAARPELPASENRDVDQVLRRARSLEHDRKRAYGEVGVDDEEFSDTDEGRERLLERYMVEKAKLRVGLRAREQWLSQIQALRREEAAWARASRGTLDPLLERRLGEAYRTSMRTPAMPHGHDTRPEGP